MSYYGLTRKSGAQPSSNRAIIIAFVVVLFIIIGIIVYFKYILKPMTKEEVAQKLADRVIDTAAGVIDTGNRAELSLELPNWIESMRIGGQLNASSDAPCHYITVRIVNLTTELQFNSTRNNTYIALSRNGNLTLELVGRSDASTKWLLEFEKQATDYTGDGSPDPWVRISATLS